MKKTTLAAAIAVSLATPIVAVAGNFKFEPIEPIQGDGACLDERDAE